MCVCVRELVRWVRTSGVHEVCMMACVQADGVQVGWWGYKLLMGCRLGC